MATRKSDHDGYVTQALIDQYDEKSRGGYIGLIIIEHCYVSPEGQASEHQLSIADDRTVEGHRRLADTIHRNGSHVFLQISHAGGRALRSITGRTPITASAVKMTTDDEALPHAMTSGELEGIIHAFAKAARRAKEADCDGVEIHSAHGYLLNPFYSPLTNQREDAFQGQTIAGRIRLQLQIVEAVRAEVGENFPISLRLGACDYRPGGTTIRDSVEAAQAFEVAGVDLLSISGGFNHYRHPHCHDEGYFCEITEAIKPKVSIPVLLTGGIVTAEAAERLLEQDKADLIGVGRAILQDSEWAKHAMRIK